jgi:hypothetical protein
MRHIDFSLRNNAADILCRLTSKFYAIPWAGMIYIWEEIAPKVITDNAHRGRLSQKSRAEPLLRALGIHSF